MYMRINNCFVLSLLQLLVGNNNPYSEEEQIFDPTIVATKIRFIPYTSHMRTVCMRVELYGCSWTGE
jgi:discoidin domain receptor family member 2